MSSTKCLARRRRAVAALGIVAVVCGATSACGRSSSDGPTAAATGKGEKRSAKALVPDRIRKAGVLKVATAEGYPPMEMYAGRTKKLVGVDPELARLIADELGLKFKIANSSFPGLIPGLQSNQWDIAMSSMSDTKERRAAVTFVDYFRTGGALVVKKGNPLHVKSFEDLCGKNVAGAKGSSNLAIMQKYNKSACSSNPMKISQSEDAPTGLLQIDTDRAVASMVDYPVAKNMAATSGKYKVLSKQYDAGPWGIAIKKGDNELAQAVAVALGDLIKNGKYAALLKKYDVEDSAVSKATLNAGD